MEMLREVIPFFIGLVLPPVIMLLSRILRIERVGPLLTFVLAIIIGCCVSFFAGELGGELEESFMAIIIDTSLVYTGSQVAYYLCWKPLLESRLASQPAKSQIS
ncbi:MAG: hypothetical protein J2P37_14635 [Ktedonobacteraceae bacterium]|jgi:drug/metabolite transporter (DMT)-like permease|nr:hypothetical protein [Ktedonobacteraceae bacterium]MBO0793272.1 hypothetical protein [Ktedonobacteraceae bacterium]